jgi:unsaturated chondroitin disaccharide hydrolase
MIMMSIRKKVALLSICLALFIIGCNSSSFDVNKSLSYCVDQAGKSFATLNNYDSIPRSISNGETKWRLVNYKDWCSGFYPGVLWYMYEFTKESKWKERADSFSRTLTPLAYNPAYDHDLGFQMYCSVGNGLRLTGDTGYKKILLATADTLATLYNPTAGTILSWPRDIQKLGGHNTIIDNMINLELLFWASKNGGSRKLYDIAVQHANTTMKNHFRPDYSSYHVIVYDTITGQPIKKITHQGYSDSSMWARGQSWAIYGFTMCYRETKKTEYLDFAQKCADRYLQGLRKILFLTGLQYARYTQCAKRCVCSCCYCISIA